MTFKPWVGLLCLVSIISACQKIELPAADGPDNEQSSNGEQTGGGDVGEQTTYTVNEVITAYPNLSNDDEYEIRVLGYIVGYCDGTSIAKAVFSAEGARESNILIADHKNETNVAHCMPVELKNGSDVRAALNMKEHPELLGRRVFLYGLVKRYFAVTGLRDVQYYELLEDNEGSDGDKEETDDDVEQDDEPSLPVLPEQPKEDNEDTLKIDHQPTVIPGGRVLRY